MLRRVFLALSLLCWSGSGRWPRRRRCHRPQRGSAGADRTCASCRTTGRHSAGGPGTRSDARLDVARVGQRPGAACAGGGETAAGSAADRARRRGGQDRRAEARPDPGLRHHCAALCRSGEGNTAAHRHSHVAAGRVPGRDSAHIPPARQHSAPRGHGRRRWPDSPRHCWHRRSSADASLRVVCARGADGLILVAPGTDLAETFTRAGWQLVAPAGQGPSRQASLDDIRALDPDVLVFSDPAMRATLAQSDAWQSLRAVREGHAFVAPNMPFGWLDEPPSINRLLGFAWLGGGDPRTLAALFNAVVYGRALTAPQLDTLLAGVQLPATITRISSMRFLLALCLLLAPLAARAQELTVFAAASLTDAMKDVSAQWAQAGHPPLRLSFGSSSTLARQIEQGAPANLFASADQKWMDYPGREEADRRRNAQGPAGQRPCAGCRRRQAEARHDRSGLRHGRGCSARTDASPPAIRSMFRSASMPSSRCASSDCGKRSNRAWHAPRTCARPCCWWNAARRRRASFMRPTPPHRRPS